MDDQRYISESDYRRHLLRAKSRRNYFEFFRLYIRIMSKLEALFLQDLINHAASREEKQRLEEKIGRRRKRYPLTFELDGCVYFMCAAKYLVRSMRWSEKEQRMHFESLRQKGFVKVTRKGMPPMRYVFIDVVAVEQALDLAEELERMDKPPDAG
jgi:hypothetical protein